ESEAKGLDARLLKDFIPQANTEAMLNDLDFSGGWTNGPIAFRLISDATLTTKEQFTFSANAAVSEGTNGIAIERLSVSTVTQAVCRAEGSLPVLLYPTQTNGLVQIDAEAPLRLKMLTDPNSVLWEKIASATGLRLQQPNLTADLSGTWSA